MNLHRFATFVACCTFLLVIAGGLVTSTGSGLAVPDWPLSYGQFFPVMEGGVLFEHGHRMVAVVVGLLVIALAVWTARVEPRGWVRKLGWALVAIVVIQGLLGGSTVLARLPAPLSVAHASLAHIFFALTVVMFGVTAPDFLSVPSGGDGAAARATRTLALGTVVVLYAQILLGAIVRHTGAGLAIPDFPLAFGRLVPAFTSRIIAWQYAHRVLALVAAFTVCWTAFQVLRRSEGPFLVEPAALLIALLALQFLLGALTIWSQRAVVPTTAHVATGALLFATAVLLAVRTQRAAEGAQDATPGATAVPGKNLA